MSGPWSGEPEGAGWRAGWPVNILTTSWGVRGRQRARGPENGSGSQWVVYLVQPSFPAVTSPVSLWYSFSLFLRVRTLMPRTWEARVRLP